MHHPRRFHLFCRVVDNFGDIGVCWRLARQLAQEHAAEVTLWVDDLASFRRIAAAVDPDQAAQRIDAVAIRKWPAEFGTVNEDEVGDVVIEAFACALPDAYVAAMAARAAHGASPVWINLEYLSAESWVEGCHGLASRHPSLPLTKHFFFPGFSDRTGGLLAERDLAARRDAFRNDPRAMAAFFAGLGVSLPEHCLKVSLFCYPGAPAAALFDALQAHGSPVLCLVPEGVAAAAVTAFLQQPAHAGARAVRGDLTLQVLPFVDQADYDKLLWACDLNFVRGEDSFLRAQWAARPFVWHIYPQQEQAHWTKLDAFLARYEQGMAAPTARAVGAAWHAWNAGQDFAAAWHPFNTALPEIACHADHWARRLAENGDLASSLVQFIEKFG